MPRFVRPSYVRLEVDGRKDSIATGPRSRTGSLDATFSVRIGGDAVDALHVSFVPSNDGTRTMLRVLDLRNGKVLLCETVEQ